MLLQLLWALQTKINELNHFRFLVNSDSEKKMFAKIVQRCNAWSFFCPTLFSIKFTTPKILWPQITWDGCAIRSLKGFYFLHEMEAGYFRTSVFLFELFTSSLVPLKYSHKVKVKIFRIVVHGLLINST